MTKNEIESAIETLQGRLQAQSVPSKRAWWERYLKHVISFRGVPMAAIRQEVQRWIPADGRVELAWALMRQPLAEEKLAGVLVLAEHVVPSGEPSSEVLLSGLSPLFAQGHIADWNTCDWLCVKVLHGLLVRDGQAVAPLVAAWQTADTLWQRRAAAVAFVKLAPFGDDNWPGFVDQLLAVCAANAQDSARFAQTGVGWALRELSKAHPAAVTAFVDEHPLSKEARNMALAKITGGRRR